MTQFEATQVEVGDDVYKVTLLDPKVAGDLMVDLMAIIAPAIAPLAATSGGDKVPSQVAEILGTEDEPKDDRALERAVSAFFARFDKRKQRELLEQLAKVTVVVKDGAEVPLATIFAIHFRGRLGAMYRWAWAALKVQYADFFAYVGPAIAAAVQRLGLAP